VTTAQQAARLDLTRVRADFPILTQEARGKPLVYLDNAATSQKPQRVLDTLDVYWRETNANVHRGVHFLSAKATKQFDEARETVRRFMNVRDTSEIIFTKGCTEGINLVATCLARGLSSKETGGEPSKLKLQAGDEILLSTMEHHSNIVPWQIAAEQTGAIVRPIPVNDAGEILLDEYEAMLSERVKVVGVVHVSNSLGTINPVKRMIERAHRYGALVLVDGAQAGPHHVVDVQDLDADFYTLSCHKIYAPTGIGVLYGKRALLDALPPYHGGGDMIRTVSFDGTVYADPPAKYEAGTPNVAGVIGLAAALEYLESLAPEEGDGRRIDRAMELVSAHERRLMELASNRLSEIAGLRLIGTAKEKAGIVSFVMDQAHPHDIGTVLDMEGVAIRAGHHCCMPLMKRLGVPATARASFALYNTEEEVEALVQAVIKVKEMFA
jgi:cysteine desulfurase / selenocysteine lyase